jgi:AcrR family transcriptional regulator
MEHMAETTGSDLLKTAFALLAERGWRGFSRTELARRAGVSLARVYEELPSRASLLAALGRHLDRAMLESDPAELDGMTPRERVFELIMRRLDAMAPFKEGLREIGREGPPELLGPACENLGRATGWLLDASGAELHGLRRAGAGPVLALVYARTYSVWLRDDTPDHAKTMAELDRRLSQAETLARWTAWTEGPRGPRSGTAEGPEPAPEAAA